MQLKTGQFVHTIFFGLLLLLATASDIVAQLIVNEANAVSEQRFLETDIGKPYEGFDYGIVPYSGNSQPTGSQGNPQPPDVDGSTVGNQTSLPNGWDHTTGWARIQHNGGDWLELAVTQDHADLRGYTLLWANDESDPVNGTSIGDSPDERGFIKFSDDKAWADLRAGTIITLSEESEVSEIRDLYPDGPPEGGLIHDTGHTYDLSTDLTFDPFDADDWHIHFHVDESQTDAGQSTQHFEGFSDIKVDSDQFKIAIYNSTNDTLIDDTRDGGITSLDDFSDLTTGLVQDFVGESVQGFGSTVPGEDGDTLSVNGAETFALRADPDDFTLTLFEDVDFSSFGRRNVFNVTNVGSEDLRLGGAQDFTDVRQPVLDGTHDWSATDEDFADPANWVNADTGNIPGLGPLPTWTTNINNEVGGSVRAEVSSDTSVTHVNVMAEAGAASLDVNVGSTLAVSQRTMVMDGGKVVADGTLATSGLEIFGAGQLEGSGAVDGDVFNRDATVALDDSLAVTGDYLQTADASLTVDLNGAAEFGSLNIDGIADLDGTLLVNLNFSPSTGASFTILTASSIHGGLTLAGEVADFDLISSADQLTLMFTGVGFASSDLNQDSSVDASDAGILFANWGNPGGLADITGDGIVDAGDAGIMFAEWTGDHSQAVPEPVGGRWLLLAAMSLTCTAVRRRISSPTGSTGGRSADSIHQQA